MKKIVAIAVFCMLLFQLGFAQSFGNIRLGVQVSPNFSWLSTDENTVNGNGANLGLKLGVLGEYYFLGNGSDNYDRYSFLGGIGFSFNQGGELFHDLSGNYWRNSDLGFEQDSAGISNVNLQYTLQYVEIPFGLKLKTKELGHIRYYVEIPVFTLGINTQSRGIFDGGGQEADKVDIKKEVNSFAFSWGVGLGAEFNIATNTSFAAGLFYQNGFTDITENKDKVIKDGRIQDETSKAVMRNLTVRLVLFF